MVRRSLNRRNGGKRRRSMRGGSYTENRYIQRNENAGTEGTYICCFIDDNLYKWIQKGWGKDKDGNDINCKHPLIININDYNLHQNYNAREKGSENFHPWEGDKESKEYFMDLFNLKNEDFENPTLEEISIDEIQKYLIEKKNVYLINPRTFTNDCWKNIHHIMKSHGFSRPQIDIYGIKTTKYNVKAKNIIAFKMSNEKDAEVFAYKLPDPEKNENYHCDLLKRIDKNCDELKKILDDASNSIDMKIEELKDKIKKEKNDGEKRKMEGELAEEKRKREKEREKAMLTKEYKKKKEDIDNINQEKEYFKKNNFLLYNLIIDFLKKHLYHNIVNPFSGDGGDTADDKIKEIEDKKNDETYWDAPTSKRKPIYNELINDWDNYYKEKIQKNDFAKYLEKHRARDFSKLFSIFKFGALIPNDLLGLLVGLYQIKNKSPITDFPSITDEPIMEKSFENLLIKNNENYSDIDKLKIVEANDQITTIIHDGESDDDASIILLQKLFPNKITAILQISKEVEEGKEKKEYMTVIKNHAELSPVPGKMQVYDVDAKAIKDRTDSKRDFLNNFDNVIAHAKKCEKYGGIEEYMQLDKEKLKKATEQVARAKKGYKAVTSTPHPRKGNRSTRLAASKNLKDAEEKLKLEQLGQMDPSKIISSSKSNIEAIQKRRRAFWKMFGDNREVKEAKEELAFGEKREKLAGLDVSKLEDERIKLETLISNFKQKNEGEDWSKKIKKPGIFSFPSDQQRMNILTQQRDQKQIEEQKKIVDDLEAAAGERRGGGKRRRTRRRKGRRSKKGVARKAQKKTRRHRRRRGKKSKKH